MSLRGWTKNGCWLAVVWALGGGQQPVAAEDWPAYQKDARRSAVTTQQLSLPLRPAWVYQVDQPPRPAWTDPGRSANPLNFDAVFHPVAAGGMVYFASSANDTLYALDAADGSVRWTFTAAAPLRFAPQIDGGRCYFAGDDGIVYCRDAGTGEEIWQFHAAPETRFVSGNGRMISRWPCRSGVLVHEGVVYVTAGMWPAEGTCFYALDAATGRVQWRQDTLNALYLAYPHDGLSFGGPTPQGYMLCDGRVLLVPTGQGAPAALDARTGELLYWHPQLPGSSWASLGEDFAMVAGLAWQPDQEPRLGESPLFRGDGIGFYELETGQLTAQRKWRMYDSLPGSVRYQRERWRGQVAPIGGRDRIVLAGDRCYASGMGVIEGLDCGGEELRRLWQIEYPRVYSLAVAGNLLLAGGERRVVAIDGADGSIVWQGEVDGQAHGLAIAGGVLYAATTSGRLYAFAAGEGMAKPPRLRASERPDHVGAARPAVVPPRTGYALIVGSGDTQRAEQLAAESRLNVICLLSDPQAVEAARRRLLGRGYGSQLVVHPVSADGRLPYADFFANQVHVAGGTNDVLPEELYRVLHPCTGELVLAGMSDEDQAALLRQLETAAAEPLAAEPLAAGQRGAPDPPVLQATAAGVYRRGPLPGAFDWDSEAQVDQRVKWPLELLWFGGPGRERTMARHRQDLPPPIAAWGRLFVLGDGYVTAVDAYNGCELWSRRAPGYRYVSADDRWAYIALGERVMQCDAHTGRLEKIWGASEPFVCWLSRAPANPAQAEDVDAAHEPAETAAGSYEAAHDVAANNRAASRLFRAGDEQYGGTLRIAATSAALELQLQTTTPEPDPQDCWMLWCDFRPRDQRLLPAGRGAFPIIVNAASGTLRRFDGFARAEIPEVQLRQAGEALQLSIPWDEVRRLTGRLPDDVDLSAELVLYRGFEVRLRSRLLTGGRDPWRDGTATLVLNGHAAAGSPLADVARGATADLPPHARGWGRTPLHVRHDGNIPVFPLASRLDPALRERINPLTGESNSLCYLRGYGCSGTIASASMDFFRSGTFGMYDLADDSGMRNFPGVRPGCRITVLPSQGVLLSTEGVGDCFCPYNFSTSLALAPAARRRNEDWALFVDQTRITTLRQLALNLGAPGDRRDNRGRLWLGYPRQPLMFATGGSFGPRQHANGLPVLLETFPGGGTVRANADRVPFSAPAPWVAASAVEGIRRVSLGLVYHEPGTSCLALPARAAPAIDAALDDPAWTGEPGVPIRIEPRGAADRGRVRVRYDEKNLYFAFEQQPLIDRRGVPETWEKAWFDVVLKDVAAAVYAQFRVTASGQKTSHRISGAVPVPRVVDVAVDGRPTEWSGRGVSLPLEQGSARLGWDDGGLALLLDWPGATADQTGRGLLVQFANLEDPAAVEVVIDTRGQTVAVREALLSTAGGNPSGSSAGSEPPSNLVSDSAPANQGLEYFREVQPLDAAAAVQSSGQTMMVEALIPWDRLGLQPRTGAAIAWQVVAYDPDSPDRNIASGGGARRALFSGSSPVSLTLASSAEALPGPAASARKREWFGMLMTFAARREAVSGEDWTGAVAGDDYSWRAELAVPLDLLRTMGLDRDRLLAQFRTPDELPDSLDVLAQRFRSGAFRVHTGSRPPEPADYLLHLHFAELEELAVGERVFDIHVQGQLVAPRMDIVREAGGPRRLVTKTFPVKPGGELEIEFTPVAGAPLLNAIEITAIER